MNKEALEALEKISNHYDENLRDDNEGFKIKEAYLEEYNIIKQALTQEVSKDTNVEEVEEALDRYSKLIERVRINNNINLSAQDEIDYLKIRNYITNVPKEIDDDIIEDLQELRMKLINEERYEELWKPLLDNILENRLKQYVKLNVPKEVGMRNLNVEERKVFENYYDTIEIPNQSAKEKAFDLIIDYWNKGHEDYHYFLEGLRDIVEKAITQQLKELQND